jgi:putative transposase
MEKQHIRLTTVERDYLQELVSKGIQAIKTYKRASALLSLDQGSTLEAVATQLQVSYPTVHNWRNSYKESGLSMLYDKQRSGRPVEIDGLQRAKVTALACSTVPQGYRRWSLRLLADKAVELAYCDHLSYVSAGEILKKMS